MSGEFQLAVDYFNGVEIFRIGVNGDRMKTFQVRQSIHYDLMISAGTEQEAILKAGGIPLTQWETESPEITAELIDETEELDEY